MPGVLYKKERETLEFLVQFQNKHGYAPTLREIANATNHRSVSTIHVILRNLVDKGYLQKVDGNARVLRIKDQSIVSTFMGVQPSVELPLMGYIAAGKPLEPADRALSAVLSHNEDACSGLILNHVASAMADSGRIDEAERFALRSLSVLERIYPPEDPALLPSLQILTAVRFKRGQKTRAKELFHRMQLIHCERPQDRALVHEMAASLLHSDGHLDAAESEYIAAFLAWQEAGRDSTPTAGEVLISLGSLYVEQGRFDESGKIVDRAFSIFSGSRESLPMDIIKLLNLRAVLDARQSRWNEAEVSLRDAISMADREQSLDSVALSSLLTNYAQILRKNHQGREARSIDGRIAVLRRILAKDAVVDVNDLRRNGSGK